MKAETALTGMLPFVFIVGAIMAYPLSIVLLKRYKAAVLRTMAASGGAAPRVAGGPEARTRARRAGRLEIVMIDASSAATTSESGEAMYSQMARRPWATVRAYAAGGLAYAVVLGAAQLIADGSFSLLRLIAMTYIYSWPIVIAINLIVPSTRRVKIRTFGAYFLGLLVLSIAAVSVSTNLSIFGLFVAWALFSLPSTILVLAFLHQRVRAVGVMVLAFTVIALVGANVALSIVGSSASLLRAAAGAGSAVGMNAVGAFITIIIVGATIFGIVGWFANNGIKNLYLEKSLNDQSLLLDSMWLVFAMIQSIGLAFAGVAWYLAGIFAFLAYKFAVLSRLKTVNPPSAEGAESANLLFLRVFSLGRRSEKVFDAVSAHWRYAGNVRMIAGPDLAMTTVGPNEFLEYLSGKLGQSFISSKQVLEAKMSALDTAPDFDGRYRVNDFFCYDDTWRSVLSRLVRESDAVFVDVRSFSESNDGLIYELNELVNVISLDRVVLMADQTTDTGLLHQTLQDAWTNMRADSPNRGIAGAQLRICTLISEQPREIKHVLRTLCAAAT